MKIDISELTFHVPPECQGQIQVVSYAYAPDAGIVERVVDRSSPFDTPSYTLYEDPDPESDFDPWNGSPLLGDEISDVEFS